MKKYRIVLVENDEDEQFFMKEGFDAANLFQIEDQLKNGDELFEWLEEHVNDLPDVILTDLNMPGKNGYDIIEMVKSNPLYSYIPVIITSTSSTKTIIDKCLDMGAADYLVKPETFVQYIPYVENLYRRINEKQLVK
ncbi:MAG: response regulator [Chitinophagaceae bacterium]|nr:MAG: response regulator [Chitinophagaceae bacterium]